ncbi:GntR family transcriptional regulator [Pikeienuella piscinae]|uniref:GntR family transcriptional regulator n=1 Tax=Pikeienuella piscinae TaxID=2748098 RepID=A0A7L5BTU7_9RHOB|nr:GntR family transcriptional regulator [Pikeienuella piscinae]QIE54273.1 GntR family transcriptional regulator [Pikeienuella piscinae]
MRRHEIIEAIRVKILTHDLRPGESVPEEALAEEFSVSRTPIREALAALEVLGFVTIEANKGARVSVYSIDGIRQFFEAAEPIYLSVYRIATERRTESDLEMLEKVLTIIETLTPDGDVHSRIMAYRAYMNSLAGIAANPFLISVTDRLIDYHIFLRRGIVDTLTSSELRRAAQVNYDHYRLINDGVLAADAEAVCAAVIERLRSSKTFLLENLL